LSSKHPSESQLKALQEYLYTGDGKLYTKKPYGRGGKIKSVGDRVGWDNLHGYEQIFFQGRVYMSHRVIYFLHHGIYPKLDIDHINGDSMDNRPENLREVSFVQNLRSYQKPRMGGRYSSKYRGVSLHKLTSTWRARMCYNKTERSLGYFNTEEEAALAWNYGAMRLGFNKEAFNMVFEDSHKVSLEDLI